jgi:hypothetical protein
MHCLKFTYLVEMVYTSDLKSDSLLSIGSSPIISIKITRMVEMADTLGLGSSYSFLVRVQVPFLV